MLILRIAFERTVTFRKIVLTYHVVLRWIELNFVFGFERHAEMYTMYQYNMAREEEALEMW